MDKYIPRWVISSLSKYFTDNAGGYELTVPGQSTVDNSQHTVWAELRVDGPHIVKSSSERYLEVVVNILVSAINSDSIWTYADATGHFQDQLAIRIPIYRYGDPAVDAIHDSQLIGCLTLKGRDEVEFNNLGQGRLDTGAIQTSVEGHYYMWY